MVSISSDLPVLNFKRKSSCLEEWSSAGSQFIFFSVVLLTWDSASQWFPKTWNYFGFHHTFPARLVLWQYNMHVFVTYFGNIGSLFRCRLLRAPVSICLPDLSSWTGTCSTRYIFYPFYAWWTDIWFLTRPFFAPLSIAFYYYFKRKTQKIWFCSWKLKLSMQSSYFVLHNSYKGVSEVFMMIPINVGLWFTLYPYVHFMHFLPSLWCSINVKFRIGFFLSNLGIDEVILSILWFLSHT
jgi:hypothetical protein